MGWGLGMCGGGDVCTSSVESHSACTCELVVLETLLLDQLLSHGITSREEDGRGDGLGEERARGQLHLVPEFMTRVSIAVQST